MTRDQDPSEDEFDRLLAASSLGDDEARRRMADVDEDRARRAVRRILDGGGPVDAPRSGDRASPTRPEVRGSPPRDLRADDPTVSGVFGDPADAEELFAGTIDEPFRYRLGRERWAEGAQGEVYRAVEVGPGNYPFALKALHPGDEDVEVVLDRWREKLRRFRTLLANPHFAVPIEVFVGPAPARPGAHDPGDLRIYLLMPWVDGNDLAGYLAEHRGTKYLVGALEMLLPVAETLDWLQGQRANLTGDRFVHGDVKPGNIIATLDRGGVLVDPDLWGQEAREVPDRWGTPPYAAPEVFAHGHYSGAADRFSLAKVVCEVLLQKRPPGGPDQLDIRDKLRQVPVVRDRPEMVDHVVGMLAESPGQRPSQAAPWLRSLIDMLKAEGLPDSERLATNRRRRRLAVLALAVVVVVLLGVVVYSVPGLSGRCVARDGDIVGKGDGVLRIGSLLPRSGPLAAQGPQIDAATGLALSDIAAAGGVPGLQVVGPAPGGAQDEGGGAAAACEAVGALLADGVDAIIGPASSQTSLEVLGRVTAGEAMLVSPANTSPDLSAPNLGRYFRTAPTDLLQGRVLGSLVAAEGNRTVRVVARDDTYGRGLQAQLVQELNGLGVPTVSAEVYDPDDTDFGDLVDRLRNPVPDAIVLVGFDETSQLLRQMIDGGIGPGRVNVYGTEGFLRETLPAQVEPGNPGAVAGLRGTTLLPADPGFGVRLRAFRPGLADISYGAQAYDATVVTALASATAGTDDPTVFAGRMADVTRGGTTCDTFRDCIDLLRANRNADIDYDGASGPLEFTGGGEPCIATYSVVRFDERGLLPPPYRTGSGTNLCTSLTRPRS